MKTGPIIYIEDDIDDQELFTEAIKELEWPNEVLLIPTGSEALSFLSTTHLKPFIIFCDINLPQLNGIELQKEINNDPYLRDKCIPFVFFTTTSNRDAVKQAYLMNVQGFFVKPQNFVELKKTVDEILNYWTKCKHPNSNEV